MLINELKIELLAILILTNHPLSYMNAFSDIYKQGPVPWGRMMVSRQEE